MSTFSNETKSNVSVVTVTIANPAVFSKVSHGLTTDDKVMFKTTGLLPTGINLATRYKVLAAGLTTGSFSISNLTDNTAIISTGSQSGTHYVEKLLFTNEARS